jgi:hypothetical protein
MSRFQPIEDWTLTVDNNFLRARREEVPANASESSRASESSPSLLIVVKIHQSVAIVNLHFQQIQHREAKDARHLGSI